MYILLYIKIIVYKSLKTQSDPVLAPFEQPQTTNKG